MEPSEIAYAVTVSPEMRSLYRDWRGRAGPPSAAAPGEVPVLQARPRSAEPTRLMRTGLRPLCFSGAMAMTASTSEPGRDLAHTLTLYVVDVTRIVAHLEFQTKGGDTHSRAAFLSDAEAFAAFLADYDPGCALPAPPEAMRAGDAVQAQLSHQAYLATLAAARADFLRLVTAFCGPHHPATHACAARLTT